MGASKDLLIRMTETEYFEIPNAIRECHFSGKIISSELGDWKELMLDETYSKLYKEKKKVSKDLEQRAYDLREAKRRINNIEVNI